MTWSLPTLFLQPFSLCWLCSRTWAFFLSLGTARRLDPPQGLCPWGFSCLDRSSLSFSPSWHFIQLKRHFLSEVSLFLSISSYPPPVIFYHIVLFYFVSLNIVWNVSCILSASPMSMKKLHDSLDLNSFLKKKKFFFIPSPFSFWEWAGWKST